MIKHAWWAWTLKNSVCIICWTVLAIGFKHWWIALFSLLFMTSLECKNESEIQKDHRKGNDSSYQMEETNQTNLKQYQEENHNA